MLQYLGRKCVQALLTLAGVIVVVFFLFNIIGGDPVYQMVGQHANAQLVADIRREYGFDQPVFLQFLRFVREALSFDFGRSYSTKREIGAMIREGIVPSLMLAIPAFVGTTVLGLFVAVAAAFWRRSWVDRLIVVFCVLGMSMPVLAYILFGQYWLAYRWDLFPISGYEPRLPDGMRFVVLPVLIWIAVSLGYDARFFRAAILEETAQDYVRTARAKGLSERRVYFLHILKNSLIPVVTHLVLQIPLLILGSFLLESFFAIPGIGYLTIEAVHNSDLPLIRAMTILNSILFLIGNIATDLAYRWVDPRVKLA